MTTPAADRYAKEFLAGWGTMDFNSHMANWAYLNLAADIRMAFFAEHGFAPGEFRRRAFGPIPIRRCRERGPQRHGVTERTLNTLCLCDSVACWTDVDRSLRASNEELCRNIVTTCRNWATDCF